MIKAQMIISVDQSDANILRQFTLLLSVKRMKRVSLGKAVIEAIRTAFPDLYEEAARAADTIENEQSEETPKWLE